MRVPSLTTARYLTVALALLFALALALLGHALWGWMPLTDWPDWLIGAAWGLVAVATLSRRRTA